MFDAVKQKIRLATLKKARANIIIVSQWGRYYERKSGKLLWEPHSDTRVSDSFLYQFSKILYAQFSGNVNGFGTADWPLGTLDANNNNQLFVKTDGSLTSTTSPAYMLLNPLAGDSTWGELYSTDSTTPLMSDNRTLGVIANGSGAGQLTYQDQQASKPPQYISGNSQAMFELYRAVINNSGASINIAKIYFVTELNGSSGNQVAFFEELNNNVILNGQTTGARYQFITSL